MDTKTFSKTAPDLRTLRELAGATLDEAAALAGCSGSLLSRVERGFATLQAEKLDSLTRALQRRAAERYADLDRVGATA